MSVRLFVAIELEDGVRSRLDTVRSKLARACDGVRWIPAEQLHVTVKFLGEVADEDVAETADAMARSAASVSPFSMDVVGCGCFPGRGPVRIVWAGLRDESGMLLQTAKVVEEELELLGFAKEKRPFSSHVTIGRVRSDGSNGRIRAATEKGTFEPVSQLVGSITLMSSVLSSKGPAYAAVRTVDLG